MCCCAKSKSAKFKICGYVSVSIGVVLLALGIAWPFIMQPLVLEGAKQSTQLKKENQDMWRGIPGKFDIKIDRSTHVYSCINHDDVSLKLEHLQLLTYLILGHLQRCGTPSAGSRAFCLS